MIIGSKNLYVATFCADSLGSSVQKKLSNWAIFATYQGIRSELHVYIKTVSGSLTGSNTKDNLRSHQQRELSSGHQVAHRFVRKNANCWLTISPQVLIRNETPPLICTSREGIYFEDFETQDSPGSLKVNVKSRREVNEKPYFSWAERRGLESGLAELGLRR